MTFSPVKILVPAMIAILAGCSSSADKDKQIEAIAKHRADILSTNLPLEHGPLTVMRVRSSGKVVKMMMLYNGQKPVNELMKSSINFYCTSSEIKTNLDLGVQYQVNIRDPRGKLLLEQMISSQSCKNAD